MRPPYWMVWNLFLAMVPLALSVWLFRLAKRRGALWWAVVTAVVVFLPNEVLVRVNLAALRAVRPNSPES